MLSENNKLVFLIRLNLILKTFLTIKVRILVLDVDFLKLQKVNKL